jgi:flagellin-like hook-associated protein FlgL
MSTINPSAFATVHATGEDLVTQFTNAATDIDGKSDTGHGHAIADVTDLQTTLDGKVDKVAGKQLSTNDYTTDEQTKLAGIQEGAQVNVPAPVSSVNSQIGAVVLDGGNVDADYIATNYTPVDTFINSHLAGIDGLLGDVSAALDAINGEVI